MKTPSIIKEGKMSFLWTPSLYYLLNGFQCVNCLHHDLEIETRNKVLREEKDVVFSVSRVS